VVETHAERQGGRRENTPYGTKTRQGLGICTVDRLVGSIHGRISYPAGESAARGISARAELLFRRVFHWKGAAGQEHAVPQTAVAQTSVRPG